MTSVPLAEYRSTGHNGFSSAVSGHPRRVRARKIEHEVTVMFTPIACTVQTHEGTVHARPGDAILTGLAGERWRVSHERFSHKYRPLTPTVAGEAGRYMSLPNEVLAVQMRAPFSVLLADGISRLLGHADDWLLDYGDGSLGIVTASIFSTTYELLG